ncbi:uncharacterized protein LOC128226548 [Mya arenaria]|nr:uncharacterized protein LOC128226548 [Mya arenaria]XP_052792443.1 uncharacterized protein LOC128226548 [Mya arenaria]
MMDIRIRKLKSPGMSRSLPTSRTFPTGSKINCFQQCITTSTDSLNSDLCKSPKLGQYRKIPNLSECDVCRAMIKEVISLKCFHSTCDKCLEKYKIVKNGCPVCEHDVCDSQSSSSSERMLEDRTCSVDDLFFHDLDIEKASDFSPDTINNLESKVLGELADKFSKLGQEQGRLVKEADEEIDKIKEHVVKLKAAIDAKAEFLLRNVQESKARHSAELKRQEMDLTSFTEFLQDSIKSIRLSLENSKQQNIEPDKTLEDKLRNLIKLSDQVVNENVHIRFNVKPITDASLETVLGKVGVRVFLERPLSATLQRTLLFPASVVCICPINGNQAWVGYQNFIQLCSKTGERSQPIDMTDDVHDLSNDDKGNVLVACHTSIKLMTPNIQVQTLFSCEQPVQSVTCTQDGHIVACVGTSVAMFDKQGNSIMELSDSSLGEIKMPYKVRINANGDICISDFQSNSGEVSIFDGSGRAVAKIRTDGMAPRGLVYNRQGLIYVADFRADRINVYSRHGHFLQTLINTGSNGLSGPLSVALDESGDLWIGDWKRRLRVYSHTVEPSVKESDNT